MSVPMNTRRERILVTAIVFFSLLVSSLGLYAVPLAEQTISVSGELTVLYADDFANRRAELQYFIEDKQQNRHFRLHFEHEPPGNFKTGAKVNLRGKARGRNLYLAADGAPTNNEIILPATTAVTGEQRTIVMIADFTDASVSCPIGDIRDRMFTDPGDYSVDDLFQEMSEGQVSFTGDVVGRYRINYSSTDNCDVNAWADAAEAVALTNGVDLTMYNRRVYVLPNENSCGWSGLGSYGGNPSRAWILRCDLDGVYGHELGHNLGMNHASTETSEYGDTSDIMGSAMSGLRQINAPHQEQMGWRAPSAIATITQSGTYDIAPLELDATQALAPQILRINKPDTGENYYVSFRQPIGFDASLPSSLTERVHIHRYAGNGLRTYLLSGLLSGASFSDHTNGISVTHLNHTPDYATVQVQFEAEQPVCVVKKPMVTLSPTVQNNTAGTALDYTLSITNADSSACMSSTFNLADKLPAGWAGAVTPSSITLVPGQSGQATLRVTSPANASPDQFNVGVDLTDSADPAHTTSSTGIYTVVASCDAATPAVNISPALQSAHAGETVSFQVAVNNRDSTACEPSTLTLSHLVPGGWSVAMTPGRLTLSPGQTGSATLSVTSPVNAISGSQNITVSISDANTSTHATSQTVSYDVLDNIDDAIDAESPTVPTGLSASVKRKQINLVWWQSTDNVGVAGYQLFRNGALLADVTDTGFNDRSISAGSSYQYSVSAYDAAGNVSASSQAVTVSVSGGSSGGGKGNNGKGKNR